MLVAGFSGIGKTAVVNEVHKPIVGARGYFIKGKFDQFKRNIPFCAWVQAFQDLMQQLLTESAAALAAWKTRILEALGENGQVIIEVIPELELLIDKQPAVPHLEGSAAQNRFNLLFGKFIRVFATKEHPLVIFLDDLQWADSASLELMQLLLSETDTRNLLLIGAYRDNEVNPAHPLMLTLDEIRKESAIINQITLAPLDQPALNRLIADTLSCPLQRAVPLTELVLTKTKGNPFFTNQFLKSLHADGLISFEFSGGYWQCDIAQVKGLSVSDDVVEFMATQLQKLPETTQTVLKLAACIGNSFDLATLAIVHEKSQAETAADLWRALQEGLVIPVSEVYKFFQEDGNASLVNGNGKESSPLPITHYPLPTYRFLHDRVQQAAYFLIPEDQKQLTHLKIGRLLLANTPFGEREEKIFNIVNQLNYGVELVTHQTEREELAQLNLIAGRKAKASTAYVAATGYLNLGLGLLAAQAWQSQYELTLALYVEAAEAEYLSGHFDEMERLASTVLQQAKTLLDRVKVYEVKIQACIAHNKQLEAIKTAIPVLKLLGVDFPEKPTSADSQRFREETLSYLAGKQPSDLINLPNMTDPYMLAAMRILLRIIPASFQAFPELFPLIIFKQLVISVRHGNASESIFAYVCYGLILCAIEGDIDCGYQFGQLALNLLSRLNAKEVRARTIQVCYGHVQHWKEPVRETLNAFIQGYQSSLETGDLEYVGYCLFLYSLHSYSLGKELAELQREMAGYSEIIAHFKQEIALNYNEVTRQAVLNLMGRANNPCCLAGESYDEEKKLPVHQQLGDREAIFLLYFNKLTLCYLFGEYSEAVKNAAEAETYIDGVAGMIVVPIFHFYDSLAQLAVYPEDSSIEQQKILDRIATNQEKMQTWAHHAPVNHQHKFDLVEAERYRVLGQAIEAIDYYDKAIAGAKENEYVNEEALANELAAKFYLEWGKEKIAQVYLIDAYYAYARWGAKAKVEDLEKRYAQLLTPIFDREKSLNRGDMLSSISTVTVTSSSTSVSEVLDLTTVIKASQVLSGEIQLDQLLSSLMQVVMENGGACKCALILPDAGDLAIEAIAVAAGSRDSVTQGIDNPEQKSIATVLQSIPIHSTQEIPVSVINYVWRTQETLLLNDASAETTFAADPYMLQQQPRSVLCIPLQNQGQAIAILYLENSLTPGAFTPERLEVLKVLSSQAAISIENAKLYAGVREAEQKYRSIFEDALEGIFQTTPEGRYLSANPALAHLYGYDSPQELIAAISDISQQVYVEPHRRTEFSTLMQQQGAVSNFESQVYRKDGSIIWISENARAVRDADGELLYYQGFVEDITQRKQAEQLLAEYNQTLEQQVAERTQELSQTIEHLKATQHELIQSEKMAALGQLVAGIAHEINTPLGAIRASIGNITTALEQSLRQLPQLFRQLSPQRQADFFALLEAPRHNQQPLSTREERQLRRALQKELESQGFEEGNTLATALVSLGITEEITPYLPLLQDEHREVILDTAYSLLTQQTNSQTIKLAVDRAAKIVYALKSYVHQDSSGQVTKAVVTQGIDIVLTLYHNQLKQGIEVIKNYQDIPAIACYPEDLNQVWTNLIHNAIQAMNNKGHLEIAAFQSDNQVVVQITDSGHGIPPEIQDKIFQPFFTTKSVGEGSGLGLDIVKKIVDKHQGKIEVESQPGQTTFSVYLPVR
jgi:PAS domain S-box-containing protein